VARSPGAGPRYQRPEPIEYQDLDSELLEKVRKD